MYRDGQDSEVRLIDGLPARHPEHRRAVGILKSGVTSSEDGGRELEAGAGSMTLANPTKTSWPRKVQINIGNAKFSLTCEREPQESYEPQGKSKTIIFLLAH